MLLELMLTDTNELFKGSEALQAGLYPGTGRQARDAGFCPGRVGLGSRGGGRDRAGLF